MKGIDYLESEFAKVLRENAAFCKQRTPEYLLSEWDRIRKEARIVEEQPYVDIVVVYPNGSTWKGTGYIKSQSSDGTMEIKLYQPEV